MCVSTMRILVLSVSGMRSVPFSKTASRRGSRNRKAVPMPARTAGRTEKMGHGTHLVAQSDRQAQLKHLPTKPRHTNVSPPFHEFPRWDSQGTSFPPAWLRLLTWLCGTTRKHVGRCYLPGTRDVQWRRILPGHRHTAAAVAAAAATRAHIKRASSSTPWAHTARRRRG